MSLWPRASRTSSIAWPGFLQFSSDPRSGRSLPTQLLRRQKPQKVRAFSRSTTGVRDHGVAAAWGFAEATFFFVVPDVWTSWVGLRKPKRALATTVSALAGALIGGVATYTWGRQIPASSSRSALLKVPAVTAGMVSKVEQDVASSGHQSLMGGPTRGVPYKLYARASGSQHKSLVSFLAWSIPARILRFLAVTLLASGITAGTRKMWPSVPEKLVNTIFFACWGGFYIWFIPTVTRRRQFQ